MDRKAPTPRQQQALHLVGEGLSNKQIAQRMRIGVPGVKKHLEALRRRYDVSTRTALIRAAIERGDLTISPRKRAHRHLS